MEGGFLHPSASRLARYLVARARRASLEKSRSRTTPKQRIMIFQMREVLPATAPACRTTRV